MIKYNFTEPCARNPCLNGGSCTSTFTGEYTCNCITGFKGENCQIGELFNTII